MLAIDNRKQRIINLYRIFKNEMRKYGRSVSFPKNTDPTKTYSWRYLNNFLNNYDKLLQLEDDEFPIVVEEIVAHAKQRKWLNCGLSILNKVDIVKVCCDRFQRDINDEEQLIISIKKAHAFLKRKLKGQDIKLFDLLSYRQSRRAYCNMTSWYNAGYLTIGYIAISKTCKNVIRSLDKNNDELNLYPTARQFMSIRFRLISKKNILQQLRQILGKDLFEE